MEKSHLSEFLADGENLKLFQEEILLIEVASLIDSTMKKKGVSGKQLADLLKITKGRISQYLGGEKNLGLRTLADIFTALDCKLKVDVSDLCKSGDWHVVKTQEKVHLPRKWCIPDEALQVVDESHQLAG